MRIGIVSQSAPQDSHWLITKSSIEMANTIIRLERIAGSSSGSSTSLSVSQGVAPRSAAAPSHWRPIGNSRPRTIPTTQEQEEETWPRARAGVHGAVEFE